MDQCIYDRTGQCVRVIHNVSAGYGGFDILQLACGCLTAFVVYAALDRSGRFMFQESIMYGGARGKTLMVLVSILAIIGGVYGWYLGQRFYAGAGIQAIQQGAIDTHRNLFAAVPWIFSAVFGSVRGVIFGH